MSWSLLDSGGAGFSDGNGGHAFSFPSGAASAGDLLILGISSDTVVSTPSGWSAAVSDVGNIGAYVFYLVATGGETSVTITTSGNFPTAAGFLRYSGATGTPLDVTAAGRSVVSGNSTPSATTGALATTGELSIAAVCLGGLQAGSQTGISWSTGYTNRIDQTSGGTGNSDQHVFVADNRNAGTSAESPSASWTGSTNNQTLLVATFKPSAGSTINGTATLTGAGSLAAKVTEAVTVPLTGSGSLAGTPTQGVGAGLSGAGSVSAPVVLLAPVAATGAGSLSAPVTQAVTAAMVGSGSVNAQIGSTINGTAHLNGTATLTADPYPCIVIRPGLGLVTRPNTGVVTRPGCR